MIDRKKALGSSRITKSNSITIVKGARDSLNLQLGNVVGFFYSEEDNKILLKSAQIEPGMEGLQLLGSSTLTTSYAVTFPKRAREILKAEKGDRLVFYEHPHNFISIES